MTGGLHVRVRNAHRRPLLDDYRLKVYRARDGKQVAYKTQLIDDISLDGLDVGTVYKVRVLPQRYRAVSKFVRIASDENTLSFHVPVRPDCVRDINVNADRARELDELLEVGRFEEHHRLKKAGLLNVWAKLSSTNVYISGAPMSEYVRKITRVKQDRIYFTTYKQFGEMLNKAADADDLERVSGSLHEPPEPGLARVGSYKTRESWGNLQTTVFAGDDQVVVDADIDDASGIQHLFQVVRNALRGEPTHPYDIHEILTFYQELDTGYSLIV